MEVYNYIKNLEEECLICYEKLNRGIIVLDCGHTFHTICYTSYFKYCCPYCKKFSNIFDSLLFKNIDTQKLLFLKHFILLNFYNVDLNFFKSRIDIDETKLTLSHEINNPTSQNHLKKYKVDLDKKKIISKVLYEGDNPIIFINFILPDNNKTQINFNVNNTFKKHIKFLKEQVEFWMENYRKEVDNNKLLVEEFNKLKIENQKLKNENQKIKNENEKIKLSLKKIE